MLQSFDYNGWNAILEFLTCPWLTVLVIIFTFIIAIYLSIYPTCRTVWSSPIVVFSDITALINLFNGYNVIIADRQEDRRYKNYTQVVINRNYPVICLARLPQISACAILSRSARLSVWLSGSRGNREDFHPQCNTDKFTLRGGAFCCENFTSELQMTGGSRGRGQEMQRGESDRRKEERGRHKLGVWQLTDKALLG